MSSRLVHSSSVENLALLLNDESAFDFDSVPEFVVPDFPPGTPNTNRSRLIREALRTENALLREMLAELQKRDNRPRVCIDDWEYEDELKTPRKDRRSGVSSALVIKPGRYTFGDPWSDRGDYPRRSELCVLLPHASEIRVHDANHVAWCIEQFVDADPDLGGEETLDKDLAPGVRVLPLSAVVPADEANCGALVANKPDIPIGPTHMWMKTTNGEGGYDGLRGKAEWMVPENCTSDCRILFLHGGSYMWYSGVDEFYRPLASRIAFESGMPVLSIDYRLAPEFQAPAGIQDALDALTWMDANGPDGQSKARKLFVAGDSSGGGMSLAVLLACRDGVSVDASSGQAGGRISRSRGEERSPHQRNRCGEGAQWRPHNDLGRPHNDLGRPQSEGAQWPVHICPLA